MKSLGWIALLMGLISALILCEGCSSHNSDHRSSSLKETYFNANTKPEKLLIVEPIEPVENKIPVRYPPQVWLAWVPQRVDEKANIVIGGHWVYFELRSATWFADAINKNSSTVRSSDKKADKKEITELRQRLGGIDKIIVPYK